MKDKHPVLTIMCGLPRSGKSTWVEKNKKDEIVVSPDDIRRTIFGHQYHDGAELFVWAFVEGMVRMLLEQGKDVIVDATNSTKSRRVRWIIMARSFDIKMRTIWIQTPLLECLKRNEKSPEDHKVPEDMIRRMDENFVPPFAQQAAYGKKYHSELIKVR